VATAMVGADFVEEDVAFEDIGLTPKSWGQRPE
jgi:hypothetical protein